MSKRNCPGCGDEFIRNYGTDGNSSKHNLDRSISCKCGNLFCWPCGGKIDEKTDCYNHMDGHVKCKYCDAPKCTPCVDRQVCK